MTQNAQRTDRPERGWSDTIEDVRAGRWRDEATGAAPPPSPVNIIEIADSLDGREAELTRGAGLSGRIAVVGDVDTWDALGARVARALGADGLDIRETVLGKRPHADLREAEALAGKIRDADCAVAVGSGTVNDLVKYVTAQDGRPYVVFGAAASMDGYNSVTASMGLDSGLKVSLKAQAPKGVFHDLSVIAAAPRRMAASGYGDCLNNSVARIDWWMSHRLLETFYSDAPYAVGEIDAGEIDARTADIGAGDRNAIGWLMRALTLSGLAVGITGTSHHGSMGEHQISHYIDCFAGDRHPGSLHGQQVGVASLTMTRIQGALLGNATPPVLKPTPVDPEDMARRMGRAIAAECLEEYRKKALDAEGAARLNERLQEIWPELRRECARWAAPVEVLKARLETAGGPVDAAGLGLDRAFYREAVRHAHEMRNRFSFTDLACDAGLLDDLAAMEG